VREGNCSGEVGSRAGCCEYATGSGAWIRHTPRVPATSSDGRRRPEGPGEVLGDGPGFGAPAGPAQRQHALDPPQRFGIVALDLHVGQTLEGEHVSRALT